MSPRYIVVISYLVTELAELVNEKLNEGWQLHGTVVTRGDGLYLQAMVR